jgi:hypothetical protein
MTAPTGLGFISRSGIDQTYTALINGLGQSPSVKVVFQFELRLCATSRNESRLLSRSAIGWFFRAEIAGQAR